MSRVKLSDKADLSIYYDADKHQFDDEWVRRTGVTKEVFMAAFAPHPSRGFVIDGVEVGGVIFDGQQAHVAVLPEYHGRWGWLIEPGLKWLFSLQDVIYVRVSVSNTKVIRFLEHCKWPRIKEEDGHVTYRMSNHPDLFFNRRMRSRESAHVCA